MQSLWHRMLSVYRWCILSINRRKMPHVSTHEKMPHRDDCGVLLLGVLVAYKFNCVWSWHHPSLPCLHPFFTSLPPLSSNFSLFCGGQNITYSNLISILFSPVHPYIPLNFSPNNFWGFFQKRGFSTHMGLWKIFRLPPCYQIPHPNWPQATCVFAEPQTTGGAPNPNTNNSTPADAVHILNLAYKWK